jgi:hypothetical protein
MGKVEQALEHPRISLEPEQLMDIIRTPRMFIDNDVATIRGT